MRRHRRRHLDAADVLADHEYDWDAQAKELGQENFFHDPRKDKETLWVKDMSEYNENLETNKDGFFGKTKPKARMEEGYEKVINKTPEYVKAKVKDLTDKPEMSESGFSDPTTTMAY